MIVEMRKCGKANLRLPVLGMGCWPFGGGEYWGDQAQDDVNRTVRRAVELGVTYFDSAEVYNQGRSEESLGLAIRGLPREKVVIGTKLSPNNGRPDAVVKHCEGSLRRLGTEYIDLYMVHWPMLPHAIGHLSADGDCPPAAEAFAALDKLQWQGKIRHVGVSNFGPEVLDEAIATGVEIAVNELPYNLLCRAVEREMLPQCRRNEVGVIGYMALMQGLLADIYPTLDDVPLWQRRTRHFSPARAGDLCRHGEAGAEAETNAALAAIRAIAARDGKTMPEIAVQWAMAGDGITCTLVGARNQRELEANVRAAAEPLDPAVLAELNAATQPLMRKLGPSFDYYEHTDRDRTRPLRSAAQPNQRPDLSGSERRPR
jgi:aryl-alcohol dehydrogenase-like predicted oxidoreductase